MVLNFSELPANEATESYKIKYEPGQDSGMINVTIKNRMEVLQL